MIYKVSTKYNVQEIFLKLVTFCFEISFRLADFCRKSPGVLKALLQTLLEMQVLLDASAYLVHLESAEPFSLFTPLMFRLYTMIL